MGSVVQVFFSSVCMSFDASMHVIRILLSLVRVIRACNISQGGGTMTGSQ